MVKDWVDVNTLKLDLSKFFDQNSDELQRFGNTVNQTFEAFVFASLLKWYKKKGWKVEVIHPKENLNYINLKFSTKGRPSKYTYALCTKKNQKIQIRHGLRIATKHHRSDSSYRANVVLDVAVINNIDLSKYTTDDYVNNDQLITFGEAKHMSAFAELIAGFIGLVHETMPQCLTSVRSDEKYKKGKQAHIAPFLYVSGHLNPTAQGIKDTIQYRNYDIDIYDQDSGEIFGVVLPKIAAPKKPSISKKQVNKIPTE